MQWSVFKESRQDKKRKHKLLTKLQKAKALDKFEDVLKLPSWNKRFGLASKLRSI